MIAYGFARALAFPPFRPRWPWIGADLQTLRHTLRGPGASLAGHHLQRLSFPCHDGTGDILLGALHLPKGPSERPLVILIHGLTGSEDSSHIVDAAAYFLSQDYSVLRLNQRGAGPSRSTCRGHYHAGRSQDIAAVVAQLPDALTAHGICLMGISLGGNVVLKFLAENPLPSSIKAAVAISPPINLKAAQQRIMSPRNAIYHRHLVRLMKAHVRGTDLAASLPAAELDRIDSIYAFDDRVIAPNHGFADAEDYYRSCSTVGLLDTIDTPTLIIHPQDDPWVPVDSLLTWAGQAGHRPIRQAVSILSPPAGGHVGCHARGSQVPWYNLCAAIFFAETVDHGSKR